VTKFRVSNDHLSTRVLLNQFLEIPEFPALAETDWLARAIPDYRFHQVLAEINIARRVPAEDHDSSTPLTPSILGFDDSVVGIKDHHAHLYHPFGVYV
jgi:hypothetical protein